MRNSFILPLLFMSVSLLSQSAQWRGPDRNGIYPDRDLLRSWPDGGPPLQLNIDGMGSGYSSPVISNNVIYITGKKDSLDYLSAISMQGEILWQVPYGRAWNKTYADSRCTPTIEDNRIYLLSGMGELSCLDTNRGTVIWRVDVDKIYGADYHLFGQVESPLIVDDLVISTPAGNKTTMVALNKFTGEPMWQTRSIKGRRSYASPVLYKNQDIRLILGMTSKELIAVDPGKGEIVWTYPYYLKSVENGVEEIGINMTNTPLFHKNEIFITSGYNCPSVMLRLADDGLSVEEKWVNPTLDCHHHGVVLIDGHIYGSNFYSNRFGKWVCLNWDSGEVMYLEEWKNKGSVISAGGMLYLYEEKSGFIGLAEATPESLAIISAFQMKAGKGPHWAHPSIYDGKLLIRHGDVLQVYDLQKP